MGGSATLEAKKKPAASPLPRSVLAPLRGFELPGQEQAAVSSEYSVLGEQDSVLRRTESKGSCPVATPRTCPFGGACHTCPVQAKLEVGQPDDEYEREADRVEGQVDGNGRLPAALCGHDFGRVRIHADGSAAEAAERLNARAFTIGQDIYFGAGECAPGTGPGRRLLAHELVHSVQQRGGAQGLVQLRRRSTEFNQQQLQDYLSGLDVRGAIEDAGDSDDKARVIAREWGDGGSPYVLTARRKTLLIQEMQSGFTGDEDEQAILELLERSYNFELGIIFGPGGVDADDLESDFHGAEADRLEALFASRFEGGQAAVEQGRIQPRDHPQPLGVGLDESALVDLPAEWDPPCVLGILCPLDRPVVEQLPSLTVQVVDQINVERWRYDGSNWGMADIWHPRGGFSQSSARRIGLLSDKTCDEAARVVIHEVRHQNQPDAWDLLARETDAYTFTEEWAIERGLPGISALRMPGVGPGGEVPDPAAIEAHVCRHYPGACAVAGATAAGETIVGHTPTGDTVVRLADGTEDTRAPRSGDAHIGRTTFDPDPPRTIPPDSWVCPQTR